ncbi:hypothetical protein [Acidicapsa ligni]|uniref:hypothetical protein n=1 Tax=Acidicapsa ligni TaxID=542300 RepID=UPI0021DFB2DB|nr:hypothetical protein [Acidicapsa ligni]
MSTKVARSVEPANGATTNRSALQSQADATSVQALKARATLLQSQLDFVQACDELTRAMGRIPQ